MTMFAVVARARVTGAALALLAGVVAAAFSWVPSVWADEGASISGASRSPAQLWALVHNIDAVHGLYYLLLHPWLGMTGVGAFWLRLPSACAVALSAYLLFALGRRLGGRRVAVLSVLIFMVLPRVTWMGAEGRSWAVSTCLAVAASYALVRWRQRGRGGWLAGYAVLVAVGVWFHLYLVFLVAAHAVTLLATPSTWRARLTWADTAAAGVAAGVPVAVLGSQQNAQIAGGPLEFGTWLRHVLVNQVFLGETPAPAHGPWPDASWRIAAVALALLCWGLVALGLIRRGRGDADDRFGVVLCACWAVVPPLLVASWSLAVGQSMYHPRYFGFTVPAVALLIGRGAAALRRRWARTAAVLAVALLAVPVYVSQRGVNAKAGADWSQVVALLQRNAHPGNTVYFSPQPTTRIISIAYPAAFAPYRDLTLLRPAPQDASLAGESRALEEVLRTERPRVVWGVWKREAPGRAADQTALTRAGYTAALRWDGPVDTVTCYRLG